MTSIAPTIGRKIYYVPTLEDVALGMTRQGTTEHVDATVVYVDAEAGTVNLRITDHVGATFVRHGIAVADEPQPGQAHWMGYQLSQAGVKAEPLTGGDVAAKFVDVNEYQGQVSASASIGTLYGGSLAAAQGFVGGSAQEAAAGAVNMLDKHEPVMALSPPTWADSIGGASAQGVQLQDRSLLPDGHPDKVYPQVVQFAAPGEQTGTTVIGEPDTATNAGSQLSTDTPLVAGNVVGD